MALVLLASHLVVRKRPPIVSALGQGCKAEGKEAKSDGFPETGLHRCLLRADSRRVLVELENDIIRIRRRGDGHPRGAAVPGEKLLRYHGVGRRIDPAEAEVSGSSSELQRQRIAVLTPYGRPDSGIVGLEREVVCLWTPVWGIDRGVVVDRHRRTPRLIAARRAVVQIEGEKSIGAGRTVRRLYSSPIATGFSRRIPADCPLDFRGVRIERRQPRRRIGGRHGQLADREGEYACFETRPLAGGL